MALVLSVISEGREQRSCGDNCQDILQTLLITIEAHDALITKSANQQVLLVSQAYPLSSIRHASRGKPYSVRCYNFKA